MKLLIILVFACSGASYSETTVYTTTTKTYQLDIPEPDSYFKNTPYERFSTVSDVQSDGGDDEDDSHKALKDFLETYSEKLKKKKDETLHKPQTESNNKEKPKSWNLLNVQKHNHPFEDKKGWVSLEPLPWSMSKISKWKSNIKGPEQPFPTEHQDNFNHRPTDSWNKFSSTSQYNNYHNDHDYHRNKYRPTGNTNDRYDTMYNSDRPPEFPKPSATYQHKVYVDHDYPVSKPVTNSNRYKDKDCENSYHDHYVSNGDIITDGMPSNFPSNYESSRRRGTGIEVNSESHPFTGNGEWVLLSTTKGYKAPKTRQRSLELNHPEPTQPPTYHTSRMVRLTVLPPLKDSKINMTTSHGGLLQVDSTFETVDQAKRNFDKKQKIKKKQSSTLKKKVVQHESNSSNQMEQIVSPAVARIPRHGIVDPRAVMAAVGAGMIPATMAMMVPMVMSGRRRRKRDSGMGRGKHRLIPSVVEISLPQRL